MRWRVWLAPTDSLDERALQCPDWAARSLSFLLGRLPLMPPAPGAGGGALAYGALRRLFDYHLSTVGAQSLPAIAQQWDTGEVLMLAGSHSVFACPQPDATILERLARL